MRKTTESEGGELESGALVLWRSTRPLHLGLREEVWVWAAQFWDKEDLSFSNSRQILDPPSQECPLTCSLSLVVVLTKLGTSCGQSSLVEDTPLSTLPCMVEGRELTLLFLGIVILVGTWAEHRVCLECAGTVTEPASWASPAGGGSRVQDALPGSCLTHIDFPRHPRSRPPNFSLSPGFCVGPEDVCPPTSR